ncbi:MAG TPA: universal stress protein [Intrasporangiaceae bacterium]|nr:universal stress protein [Intrasporangiaceae bacterium]
MAIVVGLVPNREGHAALDIAVQECLLRTTALIVVPGPSADPDGDDRDMLDGARSRLTRAGLDLTVRVGSGHHEIAEDLIEVATDENADLIVIGLRRRTPIGKLILGSNAQRILLDAPCPVIAVKADG